MRAKPPGQLQAGGVGWRSRSRVQPDPNAPLGQDGPTRALASEAIGPLDWPMASPARQEPSPALSNRQDGPTRAPRAEPPGHSLAGGVGWRGRSRVQPRPKTPLGQDGPTRAKASGAARPLVGGRRWLARQEPSPALNMARPAGFEPATGRLEGGCSIQLSYGRVAGIVAAARLALREGARIRRWAQDGPIEQARSASPKGEAQDVPSHLRPAA